MIERFVDWIIGVKEDIGKELLLFGVYCILVIVYLFFLNQHNLKVANLDYINVLISDGYASIWYFAFAIILMGLGVYYSIYIWKNLIRYKMYQSQSTISIFIIYFVVTIAIIMLIVRVFLTLWHPILKAIAMFVFVIVGLSVSNK